MENFTPWSAIIGGLMIGASSAMFLWLNGRIAGISGIAAGLLSFDVRDLGWRLWFLGGLLGGVLVYRALGGPLQELEVATSLPLIVGGGLLVGVGTRMGGGCTSGHGVCGLARFSPRSLTATLLFVLIAGITVFAVRHGLGGAA